MPERSMTLATDALTPDGTMDPRYTCDLDNSSPELRWADAPDQTAGFALVAEDLDSDEPNFAHWVIYNIPANIHHLPTGIPPQESLPNGILQGVNGLGKLGYSGPCPPLGDRPHRYAFRLYALNSLPKVGRRLTREELLNEIKGSIIAIAEAIIRYQRLVQKAG